VANLQQQDIREAGVERGSAAEWAEAPWRGLLQGFIRWSRLVRLERKLAIVLLVASVSAGITTFAAMTGNLPVATDTALMLLLLNVDLLLLLGLSLLIVRRLVILWVARRRGTAGSALHVRLAALFSIVAVTPTIIIAVFSIILFDFGLQGWFSQRVSTAVRASLDVAEAYLEEHQRTINADVLAMAQDLNRDGSVLLYTPKQFANLLEAQAVLRSLTEAVVFDGSGRILARAGYSLLLDFDLEIPDGAMRRAREGEVVLLTPGTEDRVRALIRLDVIPGSFLYVGRLVDQRVLVHMDRGRGAAQVYTELEGKRSDFQIKLLLIFVVVALLLLLAAVWVGLNFATYLTGPIGGLIDAAGRVGKGDLTARVEEGDGSDEIDSLARAFNRMTGQLDSQRGELLDANRQLDYRRRFTEAVLSGVTAGILSLDRDGRVTLANRSACELLSVSTETLYGETLDATVPAMAAMVATARERSRRIGEGNITLAKAGEGGRSLFVRVTAEEAEEGIVGFVVTFDDITELLSAQRKAAWADVARRIAHEIKNPLTPIQLAAERLKRKYLKEIETDPETFQICTDTIVRHVGDIGRMVDEFSEFGRMPDPSISDENLNELVEQSVFLQRSAHPGIAIERQLPDHVVIAPCDSQQIGRALTNLLQNAIDSIERRRAKPGQELPPGRVSVRLVDAGAARAIEVEDNGAGLPRADRDRLTEPYVTTRQRGTGLGLAIVKKIMEDHGGDLLLGDRKGGGARITLLFPAPDRGSEDARATGKPRVTANGA
jgi:two-component system nitrogen regulation sensor histidine kinase NtrY